MLHHAFARGGFWFFGTMIFVVVFGGSTNDYSLWERFAFASVAGLVVGGLIMFKTWYDMLQKQHENDKWSKK